MDKTCLLRKSYLDTITTHYRGGVYGVDFRGDGPAARREINAWAERQTRGRIKDLLTDDDTRTRLVITNAVHFKGQWAEKFSPDETKDAPFTLPGGEKVQVKTMSLSDAAGCRYGAARAQAPDGGAGCGQQQQGGERRRQEGSGPRRGPPAQRGRGRRTLRRREIAAGGGAN